MTLDRGAVTRLLPHCRHVNDNGGGNDNFGDGR